MAAQVILVDPSMGLILLMEKDLQLEMQDDPTSVSSSHLFPPGFEDTIPEDLKDFARRKRKKDEKRKKARRQKESLKISNKSIRKTSYLKAQTVSAEPVLEAEQPESAQEMSENILEFMKCLGVCFEGTDEELSRRIEEVVIEESKMWAEANTR